MLRFLLAVLATAFFTYAQTVTVNYPTNLWQANETSTPWTGAYADCQQVAAVNYSPLSIKTWAARCVGAFPPTNTDFFYDIGEYLPLVLIGTGYNPFAWTGYNVGWDYIMLNISNPTSLIAAKSYGTTSILNPSGLYFEGIDDYRFPVPAWAAGLSGTSWVIQFVGVRYTNNATGVGDWSLSSGVEIVYS